MAGSNKRPWQCMEGDGEGSEPPRKLKRWKPIILEVMGAEFLQSLVTMLEPILRKVVIEEVERVLANSGLPNPILPVNQKPRARYQLRFQSDLPKIFYTMEKLKSKDGNDVKIAIFDTILKCTAISAPWSSVKVEVVVLNGDFSSDGKKNWSKEEFRKNIVYAREGRRPLLLGEVVIKLNQGVGYLTDVKFTDNSAWTRTQKFRLALRLHKNEDTEVEEGISGCFRVKEGRVKANEKHHPPLLTDQVYYLDGIRRDGPIHKRLLNDDISTVQDLLRAYHAEPEKLRSLIGNVDANKRGLAPGTWETIINNARECDPGDKCYFYSDTEVGTIIIFNSIYQTVGAYFENKFCTIDDLNAAQKAYVEKLKKLALENPNGILPFDHMMMIGSNPTSFFGGQQEYSGVWNSTQVCPNQAQCCSDVPYAEFWPQDLCAQSSCHYSPLFTSCQGASTSLPLTDPATDQMDHLREEDSAQLILEYRRPELVRQWAKAITKLRFVIHIDKNLAIRRSRILHFNIKRFM